MMDQRIWVLLLAGLMILAIPFVPQMIRLRIRTLNWLGFTRFAGFHERAFPQVVMVVRGIFAVLAFVLIMLAV